MFKGFLLTFSLFAMVGTAYAGSLHGTVTFEGTPPPPILHKTGKYSKACGPEFSSQALLLHDKKVQNGVVWLTEKEGKALGKALGKAPIRGNFSIDQNHCRYHPHIVAMPQGAELQIFSSDPINHNIHTYSFDNDPINIMFLPGQEHAQEFEDAEIVKVECDLHSWMQAWVVVTPNPYYAVTPESGSFKIESIPPGSYTLNVWHELLGTQSQKIEIGAGDHEINFNFTELAEQVSQNQ